MLPGSEPQKIRVQVDASAGFPSPEYEKVLRVIGTADMDSALLETKTGSTQAQVVGGIRLDEGEVGYVRDVQVEWKAGGRVVANLWVVTDD